MKPGAQSALILAGTLIIGIALGSLLTGTLARQRSARVEELRERGGFIEHMERAIRPRDEAQRQAIRPILEAAAHRNGGIIDSAHTELRAAMEEMLAELEPLLDAEQYGRLSEVAHLQDPFRPPPPPGGPRQGPPPPRGERPPPPR